MIGQTGMEVNLKLNNRVMWGKTHLNGKAGHFVINSHKHSAHNQFRGVTGVLHTKRNSAARIRFQIGLEDFAKLSASCVVPQESGRTHVAC
jgi:hypothetical protein